MNSTPNPALGNRAPFQAHFGSEQHAGSLCVVGQTVEGSVLEVVLAKPAEKIGEASAGAGLGAGYVRYGGARAQATGQRGVMPTATQIPGYPTQVVDSLCHQLDSLNMANDPSTVNGCIKIKHVAFAFVFVWLVPPTN